jgi:hypothetical protein
MIGRVAVVAMLGLACQRAEVAVQDEPVAAAVASAVDLRGAAVDPIAEMATDIVVLVFVTPDCPVSNRYAPELARIASVSPREKVSWWLVYPDPDVDAATIEAHQRDYALPGTPIRDPQHVLVAASGVVVTPEVAVYRREGAGAVLVYRGRIDDRVPEFGRARPEPTKRELVDAIAALTTGGDVPSSAVAVGCPIGDLR